MSTVAQPRPRAYNSVAVSGLAVAEACALDPVLMDGALERIDRARARMRQGESREKNRLLHAALQIVAQLRGSLDLGHGDLYAANLDDLYEYVSRQLMAANRHNRVATLDEVSSLLGEVRRAWVMYV